MNQNFEVLSKQFEDLLQNFLGYKHLINPFFRISKGTPEQTRKYFLLTSNIPRAAIMVWTFISIPLILLKFSLFIIMSIVFSRQNRIFLKKIKNTQVSFLSHGTKGNLLCAEKDTFFDLMPEVLQKLTNLKCAILYTNQNLFTFKTNNKMLGMKNKELTHILLPKFLPIGEHIKYISTTISFACRALILAVRRYFDSPVLSRILICSIPWYFSRATYSNLLLLNRITEIHKENDTSSIFLTFEGHSFEQLIVDGLAGQKLKTKIWLYQHSPIVPSHFGVKSFLTNSNSNITVLTTGNFYLNYFKSFSKNANYKIFGTSKSKYLITEGINKEINKIVYAPEGTNHATKAFIDLIENINKKSTEHIHVLRLHPDVNLSLSLRLKIAQLKKYSNFHVSTTNLHSDLVTANFLVYRSSAVGIESLKYDLLPIFYADPDLFGLNVLFSNAKVYCNAENFNELISILNADKKLLPKSERKALFDLYFSEINYNNFRDTFLEI